MSNPDPSLDRLLAVAREAVTRAAVVTRSVQRSLAGGQTLSKADDSPVTIADFAAQAIAARTLANALGPVRLVAEESARFLRDPAHAGALAACVEAARPAWPGVSAASLLEAIDLGGPQLPAGGAGPGADGFWTLDPIDGTKGFIRGHQYSVCLAYLRGGRPVVAALACPNLSPDLDRPFDDPDARGLTFLATADGPVFVVAADDPGEAPRPLQSPPAAGPPGPPAWRLVGSFASSHGNESTMARVREDLEQQAIPLERPRRVDSQVKYAVVARGQADVFIRTPRSATARENLWDHAPGALIAQRAGCRVTDVLGAPLDFGRGLQLEANRGILCGREPMHGVVLAAARRVVAEG